MANASCAQMIETLRQRKLVRETADDDVGMFFAGREEAASGFHRGVTGLDDLLCRRQVLADQDVQVRRINLPELHGNLLWGEKKPHVRPEGLEPSTSDFRDRLLCR